MQRFMQFLRQATPFRGALLLLLGLAVVAAFRPGLARAGVIVRFEDSGSVLTATIDSPPDAQVQGVGTDPIIRQIIQRAIGVSRRGRHRLSSSRAPARFRPKRMTTIYRIFDVLPEPKTPKDPATRSQRSRRRTHRQRSRRREF